MRKAIAVLTILIPASLFGQRDFSDVVIEVVPVAGNVHMLKGAGGNIGVSVGEDGIILVDDQFAPLAPKIKAALADLTDAPIRFVLNTHWHGDHTGGNEIFGETAPLIAHENVRNRLAKGMNTPQRTVAPAPEAALPIVTFEHGLSIHLNGEEVEAIHLPHGHTDGDAVIWFRGSNVVHMGDDYFAGRFPFVDLASGGSIDGLIAAVATVIGRVPSDAKIIPGHGDLSDVEGLIDYLQMLKESRRLVAAGIAEGKTADHLVEAEALKKYDDWASDFISNERFIRALYEDLTSEGKP